MDRKPALELIAKHHEKWGASVESEQANQGPTKHVHINAICNDVSLDNTIDSTITTHSNQDEKTTFIDEYTDPTVRHHRVAPFEGELSDKLDDSIVAKRDTADEFLLYDQILDFIEQDSLRYGKWY